MSKFKTLFLFIFLIFLGFLFGLNFNLIKEKINNFFSSKKACTLEAKICLDGTTVGRIPPNCEFAPCPTLRIDEVNKDDNDKINICGGIANIQCPEGYYCMIKENYPGAMGVCVKNRNNENSNYSCSDNGYINCMPGPAFQNPQCDLNYIKWAKENCPSFKGVVY